MKLIVFLFSFMVVSMLLVLVRSVGLVYAVPCLSHVVAMITVDCFMLVVVAHGCYVCYVCSACCVRCWLE